MTNYASLGTLDFHTPAARTKGVPHYDATHADYAALVSGSDWYPALAQAETDRTANPTGPVMLPGRATGYEVHSNLTLGAYQPAAGAILKPAAGVTITIQTLVSPPLSQCFDLSAGGTVRLEKVLSVVPQWFGAKGDGVADDTAAWQAAVDAATAAGGSNGGQVTGAPGTYKVTGNPFANQIGGGNVTIQVLLSGAKLQTAVQIKIPTCTQVVGTNRFRNGIIADTTFVPKVTITAIARSANVVTVTTSSAHGLYANATAVITGVTTSSFNGAWTVASVPTSTTFTFAQTAANASDSTGSVYIPLVVLGSSAPFSHGTRIDNCAVDGNSLANTVGIFSSTINERSGGVGLLIQNVGYRGLWIEQDANSGASPNNYVFDDLEIYPLGGVSATGVYLRAATSGQHRGLNHITVVPATNAGAGALAAGIDASGVAGVYSRLHFEGTTDGMLVGGRGGTDANAASGGSSAGIVIQGVTGNSTVTNLVRLANAAEMHDVVAMGLSGRGATATLKDDFSSITISQNYLGFYAVGSQSGASRWTTDPSNAWRINNDLRVRGKLGVGGGTANMSSMSFGSFTLAAAASTVVSDANVTLSSKIIPFPTNAAAGTLMGSSKALYISARSAGTSFTVTTASGVAAAGTETFDYWVVN